MKKQLLTTILIMLWIYSPAQTNQLDNDFKSPPSSVQTSVYWYWMCGHISKEGVEKDLEEMQKAGINRAFIGNIYFDPYEGGRNVKLMSDEWWEITHAALKKATELDIEIGMFNCPGWSQAGGPWVQSEQTMRYLTSSETRVKGPAKISMQLEKPMEQFQDVKVIAFPASKNDLLILNKSNAEIKITPDLPNADKIFDGEKVEGALLPQDMEVVIDITAKKPFTARSLTIYPTHSHINATFELQAKIGDVYKTISDFYIHWYKLHLENGFLPYAPTVITVDETTAKEFRILIKNSLNEGGIAEIELSSSPLVENYAAKTFAKMYQGAMPPWEYYLWREQPETKDASLYIDPEKVIDISEYMSADGTLTWKAPKGEWVILRTGMTPTGLRNNPGGPDGTGFEIDKINRKFIPGHFEAFIGKILDRIPPEDRKTFRVVVQDSYESGGSNITDDFLDSFQERYGYDPLPFLPTYFGKVVANKEKSDRFLWDMRRLVADKIAYEYVGAFREECHKHGLRTWLENYGHWGFPGEFLMYGGQSDEVGGEYWLPSPFPSWENELGTIENRAASSCAHIYGKNLVSAESNTSGGPAFHRVPADTKQRTDKYFSEGINNTLLHVYIHQPDDKQPGTNAWFGTEFNRNNTWFTHFDLFSAYLKRCNYMLRQGLNIADVAYYIGEDVPKMTGIQEPALPKGYQFDYINAEVILRDAFVNNGMLTLPHGTAYRVLVLPPVNTMRPEVLTKINQLINDGAVVLGAPPTHSPSLENQPQADNQIKEMALEMWGEMERVKTKSMQIGKGQLLYGMQLEEVFSRLNCVEDCKIPAETPFLFGHRQMDDTDIYFITNQSEAKQKAELKFRVINKQPELFNPVTGEIKLLTEFTSDSQSTTLPITLQEYESCFIVFREEGNSIAGTKNFPDQVKITDINTVWEVTFNSKLSNPAPIYLDQLYDLATSANDSIKYFSGNMIYTTTFDFNRKVSIGERILLDLGEVNKMAKIWVNEQYVGGAWTMPYSVDITDALKQGKNTLRIDVVNTWVNRMIGDKNLPKEKRETWAGINEYHPDDPLQKTGLVGPVVLLSSQ